MNFFSELSNVYKKTNVAVIIQALFEYQSKLITLDLDFVKFSHDIVNIAWSLRPDFFDGSLGLKPHNMSIAAFSLAYSVFLFKENDFKRNFLILSLGNILSEIESKKIRYNFNKLDNHLLEISELVENEVMNENFIPQKRHAGWILYSWSTWLDLFKTEAAKYNYQLEPDEYGLSYINKLDMKSLEMIHRKGIDPKIFAIEFALVFDITTFRIKLYKFSWEEWFNLFKSEAGKYNHHLKININGYSLIDFMEKSPLEVAYNDGVDPKYLAQEFALQFNKNTF